MGVPFLLALFGRQPFEGACQDPEQLSIYRGGRVALFAGTSPGAASGTCGAACVAGVGSGLSATAAAVSDSVPVSSAGAGSGSAAVGVVSPRLSRVFQIPAYCSFAVPELFDRRGARQSVPNFYRPVCGPFRGELREGGFASEAIGIPDRFRFLRRSVNGDVARLVFNRKDLHFQSPASSIRCGHDGDRSG